MTKSKPKVICLDLDDTVLSFLPLLCQLYNKLNDTCIHPNDFVEYDFQGFDFKDARGNIVKGKDVQSLFNEFEEEGLYGAMKPLNEARHALTIIHKLGYKIIFITARKAEYERQTVFNLLCNDIPYDEIFFVPSSEKASKLKKLSRKYEIVAFADDKAETIVDVYENTNVKHVYIINMAHNKSATFDEEITRVDSVFEIVRDLKDIS